jgi:hypothetical protein
LRGARRRARPARQRKYSSRGANLPPAPAAPAR